MSVQEPIRFVSDFAECHEAIRMLILGSEPMFAARIGGSDSDIVISHFHAVGRVGPEEALKQTLQRFNIVRRFNGFYDKENDDRKILRFCEMMAGNYFRCKNLFMVGSPLLTEFLPTTINAEYHVDNAEIKDSLHEFIKTIAANKDRASFYPYSYIERILHGRYTLFRLFEETLPTKKVLVISPFSESILKNFENRNSFFPAYSYPSFGLQVYDTPITYEGLPAEFYPDVDWFATVDRMKREISAMDFDIALLACGSYAMPLGIHIADTMKKKAIYMGGCLQLFFGVNGRRYDNPFFTDQINVASFIMPLERDRYLRYFTINSETAREAFGAYF